MTTWGMRECLGLIVGVAIGISPTARVWAQVGSIVKMTQISGTVAAIDVRRHTLQITHDRSVLPDQTLNFRITKNTQVLVGHTPSSLEAVTPGQRVTVEYEENARGQRLARTIAVIQAEAPVAQPPSQPEPAREPSGASQDSAEPRMEE